MPKTSRTRARDHAAHIRGVRLDHRAQRVGWGRAELEHAGRAHIQESFRRRKHPKRRGLLARLLGR